MVYRDTMKKVLDYIDENVNENINTGQLAEIAAYSVPHFFRLFLSYMDMTPMCYVQRRKLYFAAKELVCSGVKVVDIAFSYGFESSDVFTRAFRRFYKVSPNAFRKNGRSLNEFYRMNSYCISDYAIPVSLHNQVEDDRCMSEKQEHEVKIVTLPEIKLIGIERKIGGDEWAFDAFYNAYDRVFRNAPHRVYPNSTNATHALSEMLSDGSYMYYIGIEVSSLDDIPDGAIGKVLPSRLHAMVGYEGGLDYREITDYLYRVWFEENTYKTGHLPDYPYCTVEYYAPNKDCDVYDERIYVPISPMDYKIMDIPSYAGLFYRAINESGSRAKDDAFAVMLKWADDNSLFEKGEVKFEVYYGNTEDEKVFCEIFYRKDDPAKYKISEGIKEKTYPERKYFHTSSIHHFLEPNSRAILRFIKQGDKLSFSDTGEPDFRPYFEEYRLNKAGLDMYTPLDLYVCVEEI